MKKHKLVKQIICLLTVCLVSLCVFTGCGDTQQEDATIEETTVADVEVTYEFRYDDMLQQHYEKHGIEMGFASPEEYLSAANAVIANPESMTKSEKEDGDTVFYLEKTNEFVVLSTDGYIRTYFCPDDGMNYFNRQ